MKVSRWGHIFKAPNVFGSMLHALCIISSNDEVEG